MGIPIRIVISPKTLAKGNIEISTRDKKIQTDVSYLDAVHKIKELIYQLSG